MAAYKMVSIPKKNNGGRTKPKLAKLIIFRLNDVLTFPEVDENGIKISDDIVLNEGANSIELEVTASTINVGQNSEGDPDNKGVKQKIEFSRPGSGELAFEEFVENNLNEDLGCIIRYQIDKTTKVAGYPGNPLQLSVESTDNNEGDTNKCTLESTLRGRRISFYEGKIPTIDAVQPPSGSDGSQSA